MIYFRQWQCAAPAHGDSFVTFVGHFVDCAHLWAHFLLLFFSKDEQHDVEKRLALHTRSLIHTAGSYLVPVLTSKIFGERYPSCLRGMVME